MDIFAEADIRTPSRTAQQDEEESASPSSASYLLPPVCVWNKKLLNKPPPGLQCALLVVATCPTSCALLHALPGKQLVGTILLPGVSLANSCLTPQLSDRTCVVYALDGAPDVLLVSCQHHVSNEQSGAWAKGLMAQLQPAHTIALGSIPAEQFRGNADPSQEALVFGLRSRAAASASAQWPAPSLPTGTVFSGPAAALLSHCQVRGLSAEVLVGVEMGPDSHVALLDAVAGALAQAVATRQANGLDAALARGELRSAAKRSLGGLTVTASGVYI